MRNNQTLEQVSNAAESKVQLLKNSKGKYFLSIGIYGRDVYWIGNFIDIYGWRS